MLAPRIRGALAQLAIGTLAALSACKSGTEPTKPVPALLSVSSGSSGLLGTSVPLTVTVKSADNRPVAGVTVTFAVTAGSGTVSPTTATTNANGQAQTTLTFGSTEGQVDVTVTVTGTSLTQVIHATAVAPFGTCDASTAVTMSQGEVRTPITQLGVCVNGGAAGAEFALVPFNSSQTYTSIASLTFVSRNATTVTTPPLTRIPIPAGASMTAAPIGGLSQSFFAPAINFDTRLREAERRVLTPLIPLARLWRARGGSGNPALRPSYSVSASPLTVGQIVPLNTRTGGTFADNCQTPDIRYGRVVAIGAKAAVIADTANPAGGYTDTEYQSIAATFDTLVYSLDVQAFGAPTDIDSNGKVILFFTRAVNELTPRGSISFIGGFFAGRDLFPKQATSTLDACPTSNVAEMFYLLVPDPNGVVNGNRRDKTFVSQLTISTTAHEFQHLINAARRLYVNTAADSLEVVWLNEGLSHIAEELLFYRESEGLTPRMDLDSTNFSLAHQQNRDAYNNAQRSNFGRYRSFIERPDTASPYAPNDELSTRGATWSFLRYAADHRGTSDGDVWYQLVNTVSVGFTNLQNVFGSNLQPMFRDWATSNLTDDVPGVGSAWQQPSWNFRSMFVYLTKTQSSPGFFPLGTLTVGDNASLNVSLYGGSVAFVRFAVAANVIASVQWNGPPPKLAMTLVRMK